MEMCSENNLNDKLTRSPSAKLANTGLACLALTFFIACDMPPPEVGMDAENSNKIAALEFSLGVVDNLLGGDTQAFLDAHNEEIHIVGDNEVYRPEDLLLGASAIADLPILAPSEAESLIAYQQNYEPRLLSLSAYLEEFDFEMGAGWSVEEESYVFIGNHFIGENRLPADHLFNFVITENQDGWSVSGLLSE